MALTAEDAATFERCMSVGGYAVFPADTVYGLACDPEAKEALQRIARLKRRRFDQPSAVLFFDLELAEASLPELDAKTHDALRALLPGPVTLLVPNPAARFPLACGPADPHTLGVRVPALDEPLAPLGAVKWPVLQTSANLHGATEARTLDAVPQVLRDSADLLLDAGARPGAPSTIVDLRTYGEDGAWSVIREGAVATEQIAATLGRI